MGRAKEFRQRLKYQVASVQKKTLENLLAVRFKTELGLSETETRLLSEHVGSWISTQPEQRAPNQINLEASKGKDSFARRYHAPTKIKLTPFTAEDLDLELEFGLPVMQLGRILRLIEEAYQQDALLSGKQLTCLCNITPTSLRSRLKEVRQAGLWAPLKGLSRTDRELGGQFRSTLALKAYLNQDRSLVNIRRKLAISRHRFSDYLSRFSDFVKPVLQKQQQASTPEEAQWEGLIEAIPEKQLAELLNDYRLAPKPGAPDSFWSQVKNDFALSPVKLRAIKETVAEIMNTLALERSDGEIIYWAISSSEPAGKPLEACQLVPVTLSLYEPEDIPPVHVDRDFNRLSELKLNKVLRLTAGAKYGGGYLTYADLSYLLGLHPEAISRLVKANPGVVIPLRGAECDIGRGVTHRQKIIRLYLEMHTETEIVSRTGHSYEAVADYIKEFATIYVLKERGMPSALIRRVTGRSMKLIKAYLELINEFDQPDYAFRFHHLKQIFARYDNDFKKNSPGETQ